MPTRAIRVSRPRRARRSCHSAAPTAPMPSRRRPDPARDDGGQRIQERVRRGVIALPGGRSMPAAEENSTNARDPDLRSARADATPRRPSGQHPIDALRVSDPITPSSSTPAACTTALNGTPPAPRSSSSRSARGRSHRTPRQSPGRPAPPAPPPAPARPAPQPRRLASTRCAHRASATRCRASSATQHTRAAGDQHRALQVENNGLIRAPSPPRSPEPPGASRGRPATRHLSARTRQLRLLCSRQHHARNKRAPRAPRPSMSTSTIPPGFSDCAGAPDPTRRAPAKSSHTIAGRAATAPRVITTSRESATAPRQATPATHPTPHQAPPAARHRQATPTQQHRPRIGLRRRSASNATRPAAHHPRQHLDPDAASAVPCARRPPQLRRPLTGLPAAGRRRRTPTGTHSTQNNDSGRPRVVGELPRETSRAASDRPTPPARPLVDRHQRKRSSARRLALALGPERYDPQPRTRRAASSHPAPENGRMPHHLRRIPVPSIATPTRATRCRAAPDAHRRTGLPSLLSPRTTSAKTSSPRRHTPCQPLKRRTIFNPRSAKRSYASSTPSGCAPGGGHAPANSIARVSSTLPFHPPPTPEAHRLPPAPSGANDSARMTTPTPLTSQPTIRPRRSHSTREYTPTAARPPRRLPHDDLDLHPTPPPTPTAPPTPAPAPPGTQPPHPRATPAPKTRCPATTPHPTPHGLKATDDFQTTTDP